MNSLTIFRCTVVATVLSAATLLVSGCIAPLVIGGAAVTTTTVMTDRRTTGTIVSDEVVEKRIAYDVSQALKNKPYHINVTAYEGRVLLSGEATSLEDRRKAEEIAVKSLDVQGVINEIAVMDPSSVSTRLSDTQNQKSIIGNSTISLNQMKVAVERGIVYLMGVVTREEAQTAAQTAAKVSGVQKVVTCFSIATREEIDHRMKDLQQAKPSDE